MSSNLREESRETSSSNQPEKILLSQSSYVFQEHIVLSEQNIETDANSCLGLTSANPYKTAEQG